MENIQNRIEKIRTNEEFIRDAEKQIDELQVIRLKTVLDIALDYIKFGSVDAVNHENSYKLVDENEKVLKMIKVDSIEREVKDNYKIYDYELYLTNKGKFLVIRFCSTSEDYSAERTILARDINPSDDEPMPIEEYENEDDYKEHWDIDYIIRKIFENIDKREKRISQRKEVLNKKLEELKKLNLK